MVIFNSYVTDYQRVMMVNVIKDKNGINQILWDIYWECD